MTIKNKKISIDYSARDFNSLKNALVSHAKKYYPDKYQDFNEAGFGSLMLDTVAYVGDMLSFYLDYQANESFLDSANERENVIRLAKQMGYKHQTGATSTGIASFYVLVPANIDGLGPDLRYIPILKKNSTFISKNGSQFILAEDVDFSKENAELAVSTLDQATGLPTYYAIKSYGTVISGRYENINITVGEFKKFRRVQIPIRNVVEVLSVVDSDGFPYFEVSNLSQDFIYRSVINKDSSSRTTVENLLRPFYVPRRFVVDKDSKFTYLQFGHGNEEISDENANVADPSNVVLKYSARDYISDMSFDPARLVYGDKFGITPTNTNLTISVRISNPVEANISSNSLVQVGSPVFEFEDQLNLDQAVLSFIRNSLEVNNEEPILGSIDVNIDSRQIKEMAYNSFSAQGRAVTKQDYIGLVYQMPKKFGSIKRVNVVRDTNSFKRNLNIYILSENVDGTLTTAPLSLKQNLKIWLSENKMINDTIDILDAKIINLGIKFRITSDNLYSKEEVLSSALTNLKTYFSQKPQIGESFFIGDIYKVLRDTRGVLDVVSVKIDNKNGGAYSPVIIDLEKQKSADGRYINFPENVVYEIKFIDSDIKGAVI